MAEELRYQPDRRDYPCRGCGREATGHVRVWISGPLGLSCIRCCDDAGCIKAAGDAIREEYAGETVRAVDLVRPPT